MNRIRTISPTLARRLAITRQRLAGPRANPDAAGLLQVVRDLGCLQLDPISIVARSHQLVLWSRVGEYDLADLDRLLWQERALFEYWAHAASIVLTEDYPIHNLRMRGYPRGDTQWAQHVREWIGNNQPLRRRILSELRRNGPLPSRAFAEMGVPSVNWVSTGWTNERNISRMLDFLWMQGKIMVAGRAGLQKLWDLTERVLPEWAPREKLSEREVVRRAAQKSLRALGVARPRDIEQHYIRGRYPNLHQALAELTAQGVIERVQIAEASRAWPGEWYIHAQDVPQLERLADGEWQPRTTLLSPFDNLILDRARTQQLFAFKYGIEIYTPKAKRQYGYYVLPILHGDRLIGRVDPALDRQNARLSLHAVHLEPDAPQTQATARAVRGAIQELAAFLGAREIVYAARVPEAWKRVLR
jgi:uncharacterized protein